MFVVSKAARCVRILHDFVNARRRNANLQHSVTDHVFVDSSDSVLAGIKVPRNYHLVASGTVTHNLSGCFPLMPKRGIAMEGLHDVRHRYSYLLVVIVVVREYSVQWYPVLASFPYPRVFESVSHRST
jgi:hypothetical protein